MSFSVCSVVLADTIHWNWSFSEPLLACAFPRIGIRIHSRPAPSRITIRHTPCLFVHASPFEQVPHHQSRPWRCLSACGDVSSLRHEQRNHIHQLSPSSDAFHMMLLWKQSAHSVTNDKPKFETSFVPAPCLTQSVQSTYSPWPVNLLSVLCRPSV